VSLLLLAACSGGSTVETGVHGQVVGVQGSPVRGWTVRIGTTSVLTDDEGAFSFEQVTVPYEVAFGGSLGAFVFQGVTRRDIVLRTNGGGSELHAAYASGQVRGVVPQDTPDIETVLAPGPAFSSQTVGGIRDRYLFPLFWTGPDVGRGPMHGFQYRHGPDFAVTDFLGHAMVDVTAEDGAEVDGVDLSLEPIGTRWIVGNLAVPDAGWSQMAAQLELTLEDGTTVGLPGKSLDAGPYSLAVPGDMDLTAGLTLVLTRPLPLAPSQVGDFVVFMRVPNLRPGDQVPDLRFTDAPTLLSPGPAEPLDGGLFHWKPGSDGQLSQLVLWDGATQITVTTAASSVPLPDVNAVGVTLDQRRPIGYAVFGLDMPSSVDALLAPEAADSIMISVGGAQQYIRLP
jgi:hypothetical protein